MPSFLGFQASFAIGDQVDEAQMAIIVIGTSCEVRVNKNIIQTPGVGALVMCVQTLRETQRDKRRTLDTELDNSEKYKCNLS